MHGTDEQSQAVTCNIGKARGELRAKFLSFTPPWKCCIQGPKCVYNHQEWTPDNMQRAMRLREEAREKAKKEASQAMVVEEAPAPQEQAPPITPGKSYANAARYIRIRNGITPPWRYHVTEHKITRKRRRKLMELRSPAEQPGEKLPTRSKEHEPNEEFDATLGYPGEGPVSYTHLTLPTTPYV